MLPIYVACAHVLKKYYRSPRQHLAMENLKQTGNSEGWDLCLWLVFMLSFSFFNLFCIMIHAISSSWPSCSSSLVLWTILNLSSYMKTLVISLQMLSLIIKIQTGLLACYIIINPIVKLASTFTTLAMFGPFMHRFAEYFIYLSSLQVFGPICIHIVVWSIHTSYSLRGFK